MITIPTEEDFDTSSTDQSEPDQGTQGGDGEEGSSKSGESAPEGEELYEVDGRKIGAKELYEKHIALGKDYSRKSNKLADMERKVRTYEEDVSTKRVTEGATEDVDPQVAELVNKLVEPNVQRLIRQEFDARERRQEWQHAFDELAREYDGADGKPKFTEDDKREIIDYMSAPGAKLFDPVAIYEKTHRSEIIDWYTKKALKSQKGPAPTERTGTPTRQPEPRPKVKTFKEAKEAARQLLKERGEI